MADDMVLLPQRRPTPLFPAAENGQAVAPLPRSLTPFIGREQESQHVQALLARDDVRLLTLTGPGGMGKTRLAQHVASRVAASFDHVWFIALASVRDATLVAPTISAALGFSTSGDRPLATELRDIIGDRLALLILDNFEQVLAAGTMIAELLSDCESLTILVTSRAPLRVSGEHIHPVPPMILPELNHVSAAERVDRIGEIEAIRLFVERASILGTDFMLTPHNVQDVVDICRRLDGLPLAIELAAARLNAFSPSVLRERLDARLPLLTDGPRDQPPRLRSMRTSIAWSHDLLDHDEQVLFARLAVFAGSWTVDAAEAVADEDGGRFQTPFLDRLASLVSKNLVRHETQPDRASRYSMLETIREYGLEKLATSGEEREIRHRHAAWYRAVAERADWCWFMPVPEGEACLAVLEAEQANIRAALDWFRQHGNHASIHRMAGQLGGLWVVLGHLGEGRGWLESSLAADQESDGAIRARALGTLSWIVQQQDDNTRSYDLAEEGLAIFRRLDHALEQTYGMVYCSFLSGIASKRLGDADRARIRVEAALAMLDGLDGPEWTRNWAITVSTELGRGALLRGDIVQAEARLSNAVDRQTARGYAPGTSHIYGSHALADLGDVARANGDPVRALEYHRQAVELALRSREMRSVMWGLQRVAGAIAVLGHHADAAALFGASEAIHERYGYRFDASFDRERALGLPEPWAREGESCGTWQRLHDAVVGRHPSPLPALPDPTAAARQWEAGRHLSLEDAVTKAMSIELDTDASISGHAGLTARELEVLRLMTDGLTNHDIADKLFISPRTAENHAANILGKLGFTSRAGVVAYAIRNGLA